MASYPTLPDPDPFEVAAEHLVAVTRDSLELIALPPKRIKLGEAADRLAQLLKERAT